MRDDHFSRDDASKDSISVFTRTVGAYDATLTFAACLLQTPLLIRGCYASDQPWAD